MTILLFLITVTCSLHPAFECYILCFSYFSVVLNVVKVAAGTKGNVLCRDDCGTFRGSGWCNYIHEEFYDIYRW